MLFKASLFSFWESVRASYWFVPSTMSLAAIGLSYLMVWIDDAAANSWLQDVSWLYSGTPSGARTLLATIASSMIGLAGVVFSITIVALTLASGQFGARLLRNFMRDKGNQITLGTFLAAFLYCLLVLRKIRDSASEEGPTFVPQLAMFVAAIMAIAGLAVLIYFIHHAASSIQAPNVIAKVSRELHHAIQCLYPESMGQRPASFDLQPKQVEQQIPNDFDTQSVEVTAECEGYFQRIEAEQLLTIATAQDLVVRIESRPGNFVYKTDVIINAWPSQRIDSVVVKNLQSCFAISDQRSLDQDSMFAVEQLVEVAVRALSPGINDPFTAMQCIDRLASAMSDLARRNFPTPYQLDKKGRLRVISMPETFSDYLDASFNQIRRYGKDSLDVLLHILHAFTCIARHIERTADQRALSQHIEMVAATALSTAKPAFDRQLVERQCAMAKAALSNPPLV